MYFDEMYFEEIVEEMEAVDSNFFIVYCRYDKDVKEFLRKMDDFGYIREDRAGAKADLYYINSWEADRDSNTGYIVCKKTKTIFIADWRIVANDIGIDPVEYKREEFFKPVDFKKAMEHFDKGGTIKHYRLGSERYFNGEYSDNLISNYGSTIKASDILEGEWYIKIKVKESEVSNRRRVELLEKVIKENIEELEILFNFMHFHNVKGNINITDVGFSHNDEIVINPFRYHDNPIGKYGESFIYSNIADMLLEYYVSE